MRKRNKPLRRYIYRDPDTGQEFMCWRGEALDRVVKAFRWNPHDPLWKNRLVRAMRSDLIRADWRRDVRLRAPLANP